MHQIAKQRLIQPLRFHHPMMLLHQLANPRITLNPIRPIQTRAIPDPNAIRIFLIHSYRLELRKVMNRLQHALQTRIRHVQLHALIRLHHQLDTRV